MAETAEWTGNRSDGAAIDVRPAEPTIGAEIVGVDLSRPLDAPTVQSIHDALLAHKVIYFRDQHLDPKDLATFGEKFGELTVHPFTPHLPDRPEVMVFDNHKDNPVLSTDVWHSDETFREAPPMGTILYCVKIPDVGGDTMWADMNAAYEGLSDKMQSFLSGLEAIHDFIPFRRLFERLPNRERHAKLADMEEELPNPAHPVVRTHPVTGKKVLYVNEQFTIRIKDMRADESRALLDFLFRQPHRPEYQFRLRWQEGTVVFWDNRPTQHYAANDYYPKRRTMHRVTVKGDRPY